FMEMNSLFTRMQGMICRLRSKGRLRTAETYIATVRSFRKFLSQRDPLANGGRANDIMLDHISGEVMEEYEAWCDRAGLVPNSISFYMRILRAVYNKAVEDSIIDDARPFRHVYTGNERTRKRAISIAALKRIKALDISPESPVGFARDMFLMSFYLRGMSFVDMSFLRKCDLREGYLTYRRRKTGQRLTIRWTKEMQHLLDRYPENPTQYLLPIIATAGVDDRHCYRNACSKINRNLKRVGELARVKVSLSMYVARHSWATVARHKGIPVSIISEGMGHSSELTTQIYLASLDGELVDNANQVIIRSI
ncbi:MAG: site-specific integrase, partial [Muribaculaceae bacterium]|nr:site-specific integrase [Muribaculaceae bacterium]